MDKAQKKLVEEVEISLGYNTEGIDNDYKEILDKEIEVLKKIKSEFDRLTGYKKKKKKEELEAQLMLVKHYYQKKTEEINKAKDAQIKAIQEEAEAKEKADEKAYKLKKKQEEQDAKRNRTLTSKMIGGVKGAAFNITKYAIAGIPFAAASAVAGWMKDAVVGGAKLNKQMAKLKTITGATSKEMNQMAKTIKNVGVEFGYSTEDVAGFIESLSKMGMSASDINKSAESIAAFSKITGSDLNRAAEVVTQTINAFGRSFDESEYFVNQMMKTINGSAIDLEKYATIMSYVSSAAAETGNTFEDTNAMIMLLANSGLKASQIGTSLRNIMGEMSRGGESLYSTLERLSNETYTFADAMDDVGKRGANALTLLINKYKDLQGYTRQNVVDTSTAFGAAQLLKTSPITKLEEGVNAIEVIAETAVSESIANYGSKFAEVLGKMDYKSRMAAAPNILGAYMKRDKFKDIDITKPGGYEELLLAAARDLFDESKEVAGLIGIAKRGSIDKQFYLSGSGLSKFYEKTQPGIAEGLAPIFARKARDIVAVEAKKGGYQGIYKGNDATLNTLDAVMNSVAREEFIRFMTESKFTKEQIDSYLSKFGDSLVSQDINYFGTADDAEMRIKHLQSMIDTVISKDKSKKTSEDEYNINKWSSEMSTLKQMLCTLGVKSYCDKDGRGDGGNIRPKKPSSVLDAQIRKLSDAQALAKEVYDESIADLKGLEGTEEYKRLEKIAKDTYSATMGKIIEVMDAQLKQAKDKTIEDLTEYEKRVKADYEKRINSAKTDDEKAELRANLEEELASISSSKIGLSAKAHSASTQIRGQVANTLRNRYDYTFKVTDRDELISDKLATISEAESQFAMGASTRQAQIDNLRQKIETGITTPSLLRELKKLEDEAFEAEKEYNKEKAEYYSELSKLYKEKEKEFDAEYNEMLLDFEREKNEIRNNTGYTAEQIDEELKKVEAKETAKKKEYESKKRGFKNSGTNAETTSSKAKDDSTAEKPSKLKENLASIYNETQELQQLALDAYQAYQDRMLQATIDRIEKELEYEQEKYDKQNSLNAGALELGLISQSSYAAKQIEIENEFTDRKNTLEKERFEAEKEAEIKRAKLNLAQKLAEIAMNVLLSNSKQGIVGLIGAPATIAAFSAAAAAQSVMEINAIKQKEFIPNQFAKGGWLVGDSHSNGGIPFSIGGRIGFEAEGGEFMVNKFSASKYRREIEAINNNTFDSNSYFNKNEETNTLLRELVNNSKMPVRAFVTSKDLKNDEVARKSINQKVRVNG